MASLHFVQATTRLYLRAIHSRNTLIARSINSTTQSKKDQDQQNSSKYHEDNTGYREKAIKAREPNYTGWWTEVMNYHQAPQLAPDLSLLLSEDHVFQGQPTAASAPISAPTMNEIKKGYSNTLPTASTNKPENPLPTAVSRGSSTFATGAMSSLSKPAVEATEYHGFSIPLKPTPPGAEDCCMSGCAHCIYDIYEVDRQEYKHKLAHVLQAIEKAGLPPPPNIITGSSTANDGNVSKDDDDDMDPGMKAFLELERKLKGS